jgi:hypothetical protein
LPFDDNGRLLKDEHCHLVPGGADANGYHYKIVCNDIESPVITYRKYAAEGMSRRSVDINL